MLTSLRIFVVATSVLIFAAGLNAQTAAATPTPQTPQQQFESDTSRDDVLILVNIKAKELRFDAVPNTRVDFPGTQTRTNIWVTQRQNLPEEVKPGVTYRDIGLQLRISTRFADIERIVREALQESGQPGSVNSAPVNPVQPAAPVEKPVQATRPTTRRGRRS